MAALLAHGQQSLILHAAAGQGSAVVTAYGLTVVRTLDATGDVALVTAGDPTATQTFLAAAASDPNVQSVEPDAQKNLSEVDGSSQASNSARSSSVDPLVLNGTSPVTYYGNPVMAGYANQNVNSLIEIPAAQSAFGIGGGIVAVIDTGIDQTHPALAGIVVNGYDFINNVPGIPSDLSTVPLTTVAFLNLMGQPQTENPGTPMSLNDYILVQLDSGTVHFVDAWTVTYLGQQGQGEAFGHGTMVSGLIHLVAPGAQIMPLRAFQNDGTGNVSDIVRAIYFATDNGAKVINMSFSATQDSPALAAALQYAKQHHVITVAAAGNAATNAPVYPAGDGALGVGSSNATGLISVFSNYGNADARVYANGEALVTTYPGGGYAGVWGTSFSAALVSGTAAILAQISPQADQGDLSQALRHGKKLTNSDADADDSLLDVLMTLQSYQPPSQSGQPDWDDNDNDNDR